MGHVRPEQGRQDVDGHADGRHGHSEHDRPDRRPLLGQLGDQELETDDHDRIGHRVQLHRGVGIDEAHEQGHEVVELDVKEPEEGQDDEEKDETGVLQDGDDAQEGFAQGAALDDLAVLDPVADELGLLVEEQDDGQSEQGEDRRHVGEDGRNAVARPDEIGDAPPGDRADVDDHVKDAEGQGRVPSRGLLDRPGDAGLDDGAADSDEYDGKDDGEEIVDRLAGGRPGQARPESLEVAHQQVADGD